MNNQKINNTNEQDVQPKFIVDDGVQNICLVYDYASILPDLGSNYLNELAYNVIIMGLKSEDEKSLQ